MNKGKTTSGLLVILLLTLLATAGLGSTTNSSAAASAAEPISSSFQSWGSWECTEDELCYSWRKYYNGTWTVRWKSDLDSTVTVYYDVIYVDSILGTSQRSHQNSTLQPGRITEHLFAYTSVEEPEIEITSIEDN